MTDQHLGWVHKVLSTTPLRWQNLTDTLPADLLTRAPAPSEWSALECLQHLVDAERMVFPVRVQYLLEGKDFPSYDPDREGSKTANAPTPADLARQFHDLRQESLSALGKVMPGDLGATARHQELGPVTLSQLVNEWAAHDLMHTVQAERALMQPFIAECGPWQSYFTDHVAGTKR